MQYMLNFPLLKHRMYKKLLNAHLILLSNRSVRIRWASLMSVKLEAYQIKILKLKCELCRNMKMYQQGKRRDIIILFDFI